MGVESATESPDFPVPALQDRAADCAARLLRADRVIVAAHIDADGLTSGAIATSLLARAGIDHEIVFYDQLDESGIVELGATDYETVLFVDFGSGQIDAIVEEAERSGFTPIIADHHQPGEAEMPFHCNPLLVGLDGASELSGAGVTYLIGRAVAERRAPDRPSGEVAVCPGRAAPDRFNRDLAALAVVGAVGDMQSSGGALEGANEAIAADGEAVGVLETAQDLSLYGKQTRPLPKLLEYASDVRIPGVSNNAAGSVELLEEVDLQLKSDGDWRRWVDLDFEERQTVVSAVVQQALRSGVSPTRLEDLIGTTYTIIGEAEGTELRDADEFATLLNATARYERADVGLAVCLGDRGRALTEARRLLRTHRRNLSEGLEYVRTNGVTRTDQLQWFHAGDEIRETIVGIVAGMAVGTSGIDRSSPIIAFANADEGEIKVSARGTGPLVRQGLDLSTVMRDASQAVGGDGGGHDIAAGATIPAGREEDFLDEADAIVANQLE